MHPKKKYWQDVKAGLKPWPDGIGQRGKDQAPRTTKKRMELAARMKDAYGFDIHEEIAVHKGAIGKMYELATTAEKGGDVETALTAYKQAAAEHGKFINNLLPYVESKKAQKSREDEAQEITVDDLDDMIQEKLLENKDGTG